MKYLYTGILCSFEATFLSSDCVQYIGWSGGLCFAACITTCWCIMMVTFPGYSDLAKLQGWYEKSFSPISKWCYIAWGFFNTISTIATIVGI
jgi:hypothetical protein